MHNLKADAGLPKTRQKHATHDTGQEDNIDGPFNLKRFLFFKVNSLLILFLIDNRIQDDINQEQKEHSRHHRKEQMLRSPEEINTAQKAQEQRRVTQRGKTATDIGHQENKKDECVHSILAVFIGF